MKLNKIQEEEIKQILSKTGINEPRFNSWNESVVNESYREIVIVLGKKE